MIKRYKLWLVISGAFVSYAYGLAFPQVLFRGEFAVAALCAVVVSSWWICYTRLVKSLEYSLPMSLLPVLLAWLPLMWLFVERINFMNNNGFEGPNGEGSPVAFMIGLFAQLLITIPVTVTLVIGIYTCISEEIRGE